MKNNYTQLYNLPFPSTRTGALFNAFSYPTKISPESVALFIACHTKVGDTVFDPFGGSGTTGIAALLCDTPTPNMRQLAEQYGLSPQWGPRKAIVYELSSMGCLLGDVMCNTKTKDFIAAATDLISKVEKEWGDLYSVCDSDNNKSIIRHIIWSDVIECPHCKQSVRYADVAIKTNTLTFHESGTCPFCNNEINISESKRQTEVIFDPVLNKEIFQKKRVPYKIYGSTNGKKWSRFATDSDLAAYSSLEDRLDMSSVPVYKIKWGELYRQGYHYGITHLHHFYTRRNAVVLSKLWDAIKQYPDSIQNTLRIFLLSYNSAHSTLMTRVVAKKGNNDFVITGAQPGVLYVSSLPVEKNIFEGLKRKVKTFADAFSLVEKSNSSVSFINASSTKLQLPDNSINYIFTDPPFGDFIPYSEINQINEAWLGKLTDDTEEVIINHSQGKALNAYSELMNNVFGEMSRVLTPNGKCTLVFHSAKAEIWQTIIRAYKSSGFDVARASILDKVQKTFKQTNSSVTVKGDPIILLEKNGVQKVENSFTTDKEVADHLIAQSKDIPESKDKSTRLYSQYITACIERNLIVSLDAKYFFATNESTSK